MIDPMLNDAHVAPAAEPSQLDLLTVDASAWRVRASSRARRLSVRVFHDGSVEVVAPQGTPGRRVQRFVAEHRHWIERARRRVTAHLDRQPLQAREPAPSQLDLAAVGETWLVTFEAAETVARLRVLQSAQPPLAGRLLLRAAPGDAAGIQRVLVRWLRGRLERLVDGWLPQIALQMQTDYQGVRVARQRTRWGSCSRRGTIGLNCCLLFQRPDVLRYLLVHELAHRSHMNHGPGFWDHVARYEPQFRALDRELSRGWQRVPLWLLRPVSPGSAPP
jgi:hypothetical protein